MANESIVYDDEEAYICNPFLDNAVIQDLNEEALSEIRKAVDSIFYKMYLLLGWKHDAWNQFRRYLVDGVLAFEIIYDNLENPHSIIGIVPIDPATLTRSIKDGVTYWTQFKGELGRERELLDAQVIYIKYEDSGVVERQSYLERLIRPFNVYRIIEQAQIVWTVTQSSFKTMFTIPVAGMSKKSVLSLKEDCVLFERSLMLHPIDVFLVNNRDISLGVVFSFSILALEIINTHRYEKIRPLPWVVALAVLQYCNGF